MYEPLFRALSVQQVLRVLAALMLEQRVVFIGAQYGHVSACAHAAGSLLYPLEWQHIFVPVLPRSMLSCAGVLHPSLACLLLGWLAASALFRLLRRYVSAPMPFVLGVLSQVRRGGM